MRIALYVYGNKVSFVLDSGIDIVRYVSPGKESVVAGSDQGEATLSPGLYKVVNPGPEIGLTNKYIGDAEIVVVTDDKDPWPDPPAKFSNAFSSVSLDNLRKFLPASGGGFVKRPRPGKSPKPGRGQTGKK
jgi:hypothetical protein